MVIIISGGVLATSTVFAQEEQTIPTWVKTAVAFWVNDQISDQEFINVIQYFVENEIIKVPQENNAGIVENLLTFQNELNAKIKKSQALSNNAEIRNAVIESNEKFAKMGIAGGIDIREVIQESDKEWMESEPQELTPFMLELINNDAAKVLKAVVSNDKKSDNVFSFEEIFVTNQYGANVAQTGKTSDYDQSDEEWWTQAKQNGIYLLENDFDESVGVYATDIAVKIIDGEGNFIGVLKAVVNVEAIVSQNQ